MRWFLVILLLLGAAVGSAIYFEWITFAIVKATDGSHTDVTMTIHHTTIERDIDRVRGNTSEALSNAADTVKKETKKEKGKTETIRGTIRSANTDEVSIDVAGKSMTVKLTPESRITINGRESKATDLKVGQEAVCTHERREADLICHELTVGEKTK